MSLLLVLLVAALAVISLVLLSPAALAALNPDGRADWERLANISQTYAAASAVLALLALGGVAISLVFQAREMRASREMAYRTLHFELLKMALDNPEYMSTWGPAGLADESQERRAVYANLIVSFWHMGYEMGDLHDPALRAIAANFFAGEEGQQFWRRNRDHRLRTSTTKRARRFHEILDEEYQKATQPPPSPEPETPDASAQEESDKESPEQPPDGK